MPLKFKLKILLAQRNMTQKKLSELTGVRPPTISAICNGTIKELPVGVLEKICTVLECSVDDIVEYSSDADEQK